VHHHHRPPADPAVAQLQLGEAVHRPGTTSTTSVIVTRALPGNAAERARLATL
jgi:hypothetical protein